MFFGDFSYFQRARAFSIQNIGTWDTTGKLSKATHHIKDMLRYIHSPDIVINDMQARKDGIALYCNSYGGSLLF
jgi:hypothetical protein